MYLSISLFPDEEREQLVQSVRAGPQLPGAGPRQLLLHAALQPHGHRGRRRAQLGGRDRGGRGLLHEPRRGLLHLHRRALPRAAARGRGLRPAAPLRHERQGDTSLSFEV